MSQNTKFDARSIPSILHCPGATVDMGLFVEAIEYQGGLAKVYAWVEFQHEARVSASSMRRDAISQTIGGIANVIRYPTLSRDALTCQLVGFDSLSGTLVPVSPSQEVVCVPDVVTFGHAAEASDWGAVVPDRLIAFAKTQLG